MQKNGNKAISRPRRKKKKKGLYTSPLWRGRVKEIYQLTENKNRPGMKREEGKRETSEERKVFKTGWEEKKKKGEEKKRKEKTQGEGFSYSLGTEKTAPKIGCRGTTRWREKGGGLQFLEELCFMRENEKKGKEVYPRQEKKKKRVSRKVLKRGKKGERLPWRKEEGPRCGKTSGARRKGICPS